MYNLLQCSETCGLGIQARKLLCVDSSGSVQHDGDCSNEPRPKIIRSCQERACGVWHASSWSQVLNNFYATFNENVSNC